MDKLRRLLCYLGLHDRKPEEYAVESTIDADGFGWAGTITVQVCRRCEDGHIPDLIKDAA